jgi:acetylornithine deacetylase/succinyl-diaminopimelate desuccinylase-like protein
MCDPLVVAAAREGCEALGERYVLMQSGAFHDCMSFAPEVPIGMIFVPSADGISHHPAEYTAPAEIDLGVATLGEALARLSA